MRGYSALTAPPAVEGAFVWGEYNVAASVISGAAAGLRAGVGGVAMGRFAWANPDGVVYSARSGAPEVLGFVLAQLGPYVDWRRVFYDDDSKAWRIRQGLPLTLLASGSVWARFEYGAQVGQSVYANPLDGSAVAGYSADGVLTPWSVCTFARPGDLAIISTWSASA